MPDSPLFIPPAASFVHEPPVSFIGCTDERREALFMLTSELRTKLYEYRELRAKIAELKEAMEQVEDAI